jgi:hypothetical protein
MGEITLTFSVKSLLLWTGWLAATLAGASLAVGSYREMESRAAAIFAFCTASAAVAGVALIRFWT